MADLYLHSRKVDSLFQLLGEHENDITYSMAWALAQSSSFLRAFLQKVVGREVKIDEVLIRLQQYESGRGVTDIEIELPGEIYIIIEAKRGWNLPDRRQLETYANRNSFKVSNASFKQLIALSECSRDYAKSRIDQKIAGVQVKSISWKEVAEIASKARPEGKGSHAENRLIKELLTYMGGIMTVQNIDSNWVYVVSLSKDTPEGWGISWIDIVEQKNHYFHPVGEGWPKEPPNYIAFRYDCKLQSIHHIDEYEVITNLHERIREIPSEERKPYFLYTLGRAFAPPKKVRTGKIYRSTRVWCMLDTLFTCDTISDALDLSQKRKNRVG